MKKIYITLTTIVLTMATLISVAYAAQTTNKEVHFEPKNDNALSWALTTDPFDSYYKVELERGLSCVYRSADDYSGYTWCGHDVDEELALDYLNKKFNAELNGWESTMAELLVVNE